MDLADPTKVSGVVKASVEALGRVDMLVNNAATLGPLKAALDLELADWRSVMDTNLTGTFLLSQATARQMIAQGSGGAIVNMLTIQTEVPLPNYSAYVASKGGLASLTRALAIELSPHGIRVNGVAAGSVYTPTVHEARGGKAAEFDERRPDAISDELDKTAATVVGRFGRPSDIARVVAFLASKDASFVAGEIIRADGGRILSRKPDPIATPRDRTG